MQRKQLHAVILSCNETDVDLRVETCLPNTKNKSVSMESRDVSRDRRLKHREHPRLTETKTVDIIKNIHLGKFCKDITP